MMSEVNAVMCADYISSGQWRDTTVGAYDGVARLDASAYYDANGEYVKLWCPELEKVPAPSCHAPWLLSSSDKERLGVDYPPPLKTLGFKGGGKKGPPPKKAKGGDRDKIKAKRRQKSRVQASYL